MNKEVVFTALALITAVGGMVKGYRSRIDEVRMSAESDEERKAFNRFRANTNCGAAPLGEEVKEGEA